MSDTMSARAATLVPALSTAALAVGYRGETVVEGVDIYLPRGAILALVGANGSGKSTLLKTLAGLLPPLAGEVTVLGGAPLARPAEVAFLGQSHGPGFMLPLRARDVVRMARFAGRGLLGRMDAEDEEAVSEAMSLMGLEGLAELPINAMSGGQRQRVFIAQAIARRAALILLDEPAAGLDAAARESYRGWLRAAAGSGASVVVATHDIEEAASCDQAMLLARRVVAYGRGEEALGAEALLATFGIVGKFREGRIVLVEREHGHDCDN